MSTRQIIITIPTTTTDGARGRTEMSLEEFCQLNISQCTMARIQEQGQLLSNVNLFTQMAGGGSGGATRGRGGTRGGGGGSCGGRRGRLPSQVSVSPGGDISTSFNFDNTALTAIEKKKLETSTLSHGRKLSESSDKQKGGESSDKTVVFESSGVSDGDHTLVFESSGVSDADQTVVFEPSGVPDADQTVKMEGSAVERKKSTIVEISVHSDLKTIEKITRAFDNLRKKHASKDLKLSYSTYVKLTPTGDGSSGDTSGASSVVFGKKAPIKQEASIKQETSADESVDVTHISETSLDVSEKENSAEVQPNLGGDSSSGQTNEQSGSDEKNGGQGDDAHGDSEKKDEVVLEDNQKGHGDDAHSDSEKKDEVVMEDSQKGHGDDDHGDSEKKDEVALGDSQNSGHGDDDHGDSEKKDEVALGDSQNSGHGDDAHGDSEKKDEVALGDSQKGHGDDAHGDSEKKDEVALGDSQKGHGDSHNGDDDVHPDDSEKKEISAESHNGDDDVPHGDSVKKNQNADSEESDSTDHNHNVVILKTPRRNVKGRKGGDTVRSDVGNPVVYDLTNDDKVLPGSSFGNFFKADASSSSVVLFPSDNSSVSLEHIDSFLHRMPKDRPLKEFIDCDFKMEVSLVEQFIDDKDPSQGDELGKSTYYCRLTIF